MAYFDILNPLGVTHECDRQTDGQTDRRMNILVANAALNCVVQPKAEHSEHRGKLDIKAHNILGENHTLLNKKLIRR